MTFSSKIWMALASAGFVAAGIGTAQAQASYGDIAAPGVYYGSGNVNGGWTFNTFDGIEIALRAKDRGTGLPTEGALGIYVENSGLCNPTCSGGPKASWNYDFSVYSNSLIPLSKLAVQLSVDTDPGAGVHFVPIANAYTNWNDNTYYNPTTGTHVGGTPAFGDKGLQQSVNPLFGNSGFQPGFNPYAPGLYDIQLSVYNALPSGLGALHGTTSIQVQVVPEPETYALMLAGLGLMGFIARRRKQKESAA